MLNENFLLKMKELLGDEYSEFVSALTEKDAVHGLRVNTVKISVEDFLKNTTLPTTKLSYAEEGFILGQVDSIGTTPDHHSGMIYMQDPGAMATLCALDIKEGWKVLDMCSAPGGKSTQAAAKIGESGFIVSNEFVPKRAKITVGNFERLGIKNGIVTSLDTSELPKLFSEVFDLVIADVPCSGEGMFRKSEEALCEWSISNVELCAKRGFEILSNAKNLVAEGGYLIYSTCTYSLEENEMAVDKFLSENPEYSLVPTKKELSAVTRDGIFFNGCKTDNIHLARRFYPHVCEGEGQFVALMQKRKSTRDVQTFLYKDASTRPTRQEEETVNKFFRENLSEIPVGRIAKVGENLVLISHGCPVPPRSVFSAGVLIGKVEKGILFPSHQFFSCYGDHFKNIENLDGTDVRLKKYLLGEEIDAKSVNSGWCAVTYCGVALGGGKASGGKIKNHYPKGLSLKK